MHIQNSALLNIRKFYRIPVLSDLTGNELLIMIMAKVSSATQTRTMNIRIFGFILIAASLFMAIGDAYSYFRYGSSLSLGDIWGAINLASLNLTQVFIQRYVWSPLWTYFVNPILLMPAWLAILIAGGACLFLSIKKEEQ